MRPSASRSRSAAQRRPGPGDGGSIGITTGEAIVQPVPSIPDRKGIIGDVVNTASRLEGLAEPGSVVVDEGTHRGELETFSFDDGESVTVRGDEDTLGVWLTGWSRPHRGSPTTPPAVQPPNPWRPVDPNN